VSLASIQCLLFSLCYLGNPGCENRGVNQLI